MTVFQFVITGEEPSLQGYPLKSRIVHPFSGKRVEMKLLQLQFRQTEKPNAEPPIIKLFPKFPLRLDITRGLTTDAGTAFDPTFSIGLKSNSSQLGFMFANDNCDLHMNDMVYHGYCLGNAMELQLTFATNAPGHPLTTADITTVVDTLILTVDIKEIN